MEQENSVIYVDNFDPFYSRSIKLNNVKRHLDNPDFQLIEADIRNLDQLKKEIEEDVDVIIHLAAKAGVRPSIKDPIGYQQVNVMGTQNMLEFTKERDIKQFVFASSSSVYGTNEN